LSSMNSDTNERRIRRLRRIERAKELRALISVSSLWLSIPLFAVFWITDYFYVPEKFLLFGLIRLTIVPACLLVNAEVRASRSILKLQSWGAFYAFSNAILITAMSFLAGGKSSAYYAGLNLCAIAGGSFIPWTTGFLVLNLALIYVPFLGLSLLTWNVESNAVFITNVFFMGATVIITVVVRHFNETYRLSAIRSRVALDDELDRRATIIQEKTEEAVRLEEQFRQSQKMEAVGRLAGGVAHDFNNLLMAIQGYAEVLRDSLPVHDGLRKNTEQILKAANRAASLTSQMLAFSRKQILTPVVLDLNEVIDETAKMLKRLIGEDVELRIHPSQSLWAVEADPNQMVQVVMNLCVNARDAMPNGGVLTIATANVTASKMSLEKGASDLTRGEYVKLTVSDTGLGISKEMQELIFEPFFTTKEIGKGTGLGLAMVYGVVKQSGGHVSVDSEMGRGTRFTIYLPRVMQDITTEVNVPDEEQPRGMETILIAEDEEAVREALSDYMRGLGYAVLTADSGPRALAVAAAYEGTIELLISDVVMPGMNGRELSEKLTDLRPTLRTVFMTGYTDDEVLRHGIKKLGATLLQKPFHLDTLAREVRGVLAEQKQFDPSRT